MVHLAWSGHGYLVAVSAFGSCLLMELTTRAVFQDNSYYQDHVWPMPVALVVSGLVCLVVGCLLNRDQPRTLVDIETGEKVVEPRNRHTFFFIPVQYWGPLLILLAGVAAIYHVVHGKI